MLQDIKNTCPMPYCLGVLKEHWDTGITCNKCLKKIKRCSSDTCRTLNRLESSYCRECKAIFKQDALYNQNHQGINWRYRTVLTEERSLKPSTSLLNLLASHNSELFSPFMSNEGLVFPTEYGFTIYQIENKHQPRKLLSKWEANIQTKGLIKHQPIQIKNFFYYAIETDMETRICSLMTTSGKVKVLATFPKSEVKLSEGQNPVVHTKKHKTEPDNTIFWSLTSGVLLLKVTRSEVEAKYLKFVGLQERVEYLYQACITQKYAYFLSNKGKLFRINPDESLQLLSILVVPPVISLPEIDTCSQAITIEDTDNKPHAIAWISRTLSGHHGEINVHYYSDTEVNLTSPLNTEGEEEFFTNSTLHAPLCISSELFVFSYHAGLYRINVMDDGSLTPKHFQNGRDLLTDCYISGSNLTVVLKDNLIQSLHLDQSNGFSVEDLHRIEFIPIMKPTVFRNELYIMGNDALHIFPLGED